jgi:hypothetical protein
MSHRELRKRDISQLAGIYVKRPQFRRNLNCCSAVKKKKYMSVNQQSTVDRGRTEKEKFPNYSQTN